MVNEEEIIRLNFSYWSDGGFPRFISNVDPLLTITINEYYPNNVTISRMNMSDKGITVVILDSFSPLGIDEVKERLSNHLIEF